jgi:hypothetical protein
MRKITRSHERPNAPVPTNKSHSEFQNRDPERRRKMPERVLQQSPAIRQETVIPIKFL